MKRGGAATTGSDRPSLSHARLLLPSDYGAASADAIQRQHLIIR
jgi:hypothetical protein